MKINSNSKAWIKILFVAFMPTLFAGCQSIPSLRVVSTGLEGSFTDMSSNSVVLGGNIASPQVIKFASSGIKLRKVIALGGTVNGRSIQQRLDLEEFKNKFNALKQTKENSINKDVLRAQLNSYKLGLGDELFREMQDHIEGIPSPYETEFKNLARQWNSERDDLLKKIANSGYSPLSKTSKHLVRITKNGSRKNYYYPYDLVSIGIAGEIILGNGDLVQVIDLNNTALTSNEITRTRNLKFIISTPSSTEPGSTTEPYFEQVSKKIEIESQLAITSVVLRRNSSTGLGSDFYVIPLDWLAGDLRNSNIQDGDVFIAATDVDIPLVFSSLVEQVTNRKKAALNQRPATSRFASNNQVAISRLRTLGRTLLYRLGF